MSKRSKDNRDSNDALRMEDIVPPFGKARPRPPKAANQSKPSAEERPTGESSNPQDIPRFDLAERIMSTQRKNTAARRSGPQARRRQASTAEPTGSAIPAEIPLLSEHQKIISEIVARDIDRFCNEC